MGNKKNRLSKKVSSLKKQLADAGKEIERLKLIVADLQHNESAAMFEATPPPNLWY